MALVSHCRVKVYMLEAPHLRSAKWWTTNGARDEGAFNMGLADIFCQSGAKNRQGSEADVK